jgi:hypothetical protein
MSDIERLLAERGITGGWLEEKGILPEVAWMRGYYRQSKTDISRGRAEYEDLPRGLTRDGRRRSSLQGFMTRIMNQSDGLMRPQHFPSEMERRLCQLHMGTAHIWTQFRPDDVVATGDWQDHEPHWATRAWRYHLVRHEDHGNRRGMSDKEVDALSVAEIRAIATEGERARIAESASRPEPERRRARQVRWHRQHRHVDTGRFINVPCPKLNGVKDYRYEYAKRIDVNPLVTGDMLREAEILLFVIEGAQKGDTALSMILSRQLSPWKAAVLSVPAVGQWRARELPDFIRQYGQNKYWFVIADSDAHRNPQVMTQAFRCRRFLRNRGAKAYVMLPPECFGVDEKAGLDDFAGSRHGGHLRDCVVIHRESDLGQYLKHGWFDHPSFTSSFGGRRIDRRTNCATTGFLLSELADPEGFYQASYRAAGRHMGIHHEQVRRHLEDLRQWGFVELVDGSFDTRRNEYTGRREWTSSPILKFHPSIRATQTTQRLGDFLTEIGDGKDTMQQAQLDRIERKLDKVLDGVRRDAADSLDEQPNAEQVQVAVERFIESAQR